MNNPWQILGLSRDAATEKEVKSAYARLIKQNRPDTDPEGFQRVRQAYEAALAMLKNGSSQGETTEPLAGDTASAPPALIEAELAVHRALEADDQEAVARAVGALFPICCELRPGKAGLQLWVETLHRVTDGSAKLVAMGVATSQMLHELESGSAVVTHTVISYWESAHDTDSLSWLAEAVMADAGKLGNQDSGIVALRLAVEIGFVRPALASALITFAFPHIDRQAREQLIPQAEQQAALGNLMVGLRKDQTAFWQERLRNPNHAWDWNDEASKTALDYLARETAPHWSGFGIIQEVAPADWFARLQKEMRRRQGWLMGKFRPATLGRPRPQPKSSGESYMKHLFSIVFMLLLTLPRLLPQCTSRTIPPHGSDTSEYRAPAITPLPDIPSSGIDAIADEAAMAAGKAHADKLLQADNSLRSWVEGSHAIGSTARAKLAEARTPSLQDEARKKYVIQLYQLIQELGQTSRTHARVYRFLELLVYSPDTSPLERLVALDEMVGFEPVDMLLPVWEEATGMGSQVSHQISIVAAAFIRDRGPSLTPRQRERMEALAKRAK